MSGILRLEDPSDIVSHVRHDHARIEEMLARFDSTARDRWSEIFPELVRLLVSHEVAEEEVMYPVLRRYSDEAARLADECVSEQAESERRLDKMERLEPASAEFLSEMSLLRAALLEHAAHEEREVLPLIARLAEPDRTMLGGRFERARTMAPTHPHPRSPDAPPGDLVVGTIAALADRLRDAVRRDN